MLCQILGSFPLKYISGQRGDHNCTSGGSRCHCNTSVPGDLKAGNSPDTVTGAEHESDRDR